jgi:probable F420-dependent oxidoreductase
MRFGIGLPGDPPLQEQIDRAILAERAGFHDVWCWDSHILKQDCSVLMTLVAAETASITVGSSVMNPITRDPTVTASFFATLAGQVGNDRLTCGIGTGGSAIKLRGLRRSNLETLEAAVQVIRGLTAGDEVTFEGKQMKLNWASGGPVPILVGASGPRALQLAGRVADGVILSVADPVFVRWALDQVRTGFSEAGRSGDDFRVQVAAPGFVSEDMAEARAQVRWFAAFMGNHIVDVLRDQETDPEGRKLWDYGETRPDYNIRQHGSRGNNPTDYVPDEVVDRFTIIGNAGETIAKLHALEDAGATEVNLYLPDKEPERIIEAYGQAIIPSFASPLARG